MSNRPRILILLVSCILFFGIGLFSTIGPALPDLARNTGITLAEAGVLFSALYVGAVSMQIVAGQLTEKFGLRSVLVGGCILLGMGIFGLTISTSLPLALVSMLIAGLGDGVAIVVSNVLVVQSFNARRLAALNLANVFFGLGAIAGPALAAFFLQQWHSAVPAFWVQCVVVLLPIPLVLLMQLPGRPIQANEVKPKASIYRAPLLWLSGAVLFVYVGTEIGIGGWGVTFLGRTTTLDAGSAALVLSAFWVSFTGGRLLAAFLSTFYPLRFLLTGSLTGALVGVLLLLSASGNSPLTIGALLLIAVSLGPIFPTIVALVTTLFPESAARAAAAVMFLGSLGGLILPWLQGLILVGFGPLLYLLLVLLCVLLMLGLYEGSRLLQSAEPAHLQTPIDLA